MKWINFLHFYQPANTDAHKIKEASEMSYYRILKALAENKRIKFTLNISGCLFYRWEELGYRDLIGRIKALLQKGQIELSGTAAYHPILPLIPEKEIKAQITENEEILKKHFGKDFKPRGFFLPEMAYSSEAAKIIKSLGYKWLILDEIALDQKLNGLKSNRVYKDQNSGLDVVLRSRKLSNSYVPRTITEIMQKNAEDRPESVITATDGELYGLRHIDHGGIFEKLLKNDSLKTATISEFIASDRKRTAIEPPAHSWETSLEELKNKEPFNLWQNKNNFIQKKLWQLTRLAYNTIEENKADNNYYWARWHFVRGLASCTYWWASAKDFFEQFGPISWNPDEIERGVNEHIRSIRALDSEETREVKMKAEKLYIDIKKMIWEQHWAYHWKKNQ